MTILPWLPEDDVDAMPTTVTDDAPRIIIESALEDDMEIDVFAMQPMNEICDENMNYEIDSEASPGELHTGVECAAMEVDVEVVNESIATDSDGQQKVGRK